jgi:protein involved in polysaccharide export with SLBB domain
MENRERASGLKARLLGAVMLCATLCPLPAFGQTAAQWDRTRAMDTAESRAEKAADELVSLSADRIISLLRSEPGLLLQAKKALVRKAYEQGRLLDPEDLTDDSLFRLIREDVNVRILMTQQIEDRYYIRAKPTREELEQGLVSRSMPPQKEGTPSPQTKQTENQEDAYWSSHIGPEERYPLYQTLPYSQSSQPEPSSQSPSYNGAPSYNPAPPAPNPQQPQPAGPSNNDARRQLQMAQMQPPPGDYPDAAPGESNPMARISPEELPQLLAASNRQSVAGGSEMPGGTGLGVSGLTPETTTSAGSMLGVPSGNQQPYPQEARQEVPPQWQMTRSRSYPSQPRQPALRHRPDPYADVPSLYDLYSQYAGHSPVLERFGADIFRNGTGNFNQLPMDMPVGPDYVLGPGDGVSIDLWGGVSERLLRVVDRQGRVALPEVGAVEVSGKSLGDVQQLVQTALRTQFRDVQADVSLSRLRSVRVYVVGDVERPGAYDISALSTPLNAVYMAGGPTSAGSLRIIRHYRGQQLLQQVDVYDLLLHGVQSDLQGLQPGDTILVPPLGPEVTVEGMVRRPAIYELNGEKDLAEILELAGGVLQTGTLRHVDVERVEAHESRTMLRLDIPENDNQAGVTQALDDFQIQDGDKVKISPILPYADKTVYLEGHVFRPGKFAYRDGMKITDLIHSYKDLLPEPYLRHAEIIRLSPPDYKPEVLAFNLADALEGKAQDVDLKPFDTVRVFGRFDFEDPPVITVSGEVRDPGDHITNGATYLRDAVYLAGGTASDAELSDAQVFRKTDDGKLKVISVDLSKALSGDPKDNILLQPKDRLFIHRDLARTDPPSVQVQGEVARPGKYPLGEGMSAADLVRLAGGLKRGAYTEEADLTRYTVEGGSQMLGEHLTVPLAKALAEEPDSDVRLHDGDVLTVRELAGWTDVGATITVKGEVLHPGTYGIKEGERLSSVIARAGGLRSDAYPYGALFERAQVRELEEKNHQELIRQIQDQGANLRQAPDGDQDQKLAKAAALQQWETTLQELQDTPPGGRMVIHISSKMKRWTNTSADIQVRAGDSIYIPKKPNTVIVDGSVYNPTAITYKPGRSANWYLRQAGGPTGTANKKAIFVIRADGSVVGGSGGLFSGGVGSAALQPGDMVVVPQKVFSANTHWKSVLEGAQLAYAVGIAIQVARSF